MLSNTLKYLKIKGIWRLPIRPGSGCARKSVLVPWNSIIIKWWGSPMAFFLPDRNAGTGKYP
jgi:hypothetical protein